MTWGGPLSAPGSPIFPSAARLLPKGFSGHVSPCGQHTSQKPCVCRGVARRPCGRPQTGWWHRRPFEACRGAPAPGLSVGSRGSSTPGQPQREVEDGPSQHPISERVHGGVASPLWPLPGNAVFIARVVSVPADISP